MRRVKYYDRVLKEVLDTQDSSRVTTTGWHHFNCPFCDDKSAHLGINVETGAVKCLRCGFRHCIGKRDKSKKDSIAPVYQGTFSLAMTNEEIDKEVELYMSGRGVRSQCGWGYGRGEKMGHVAFPSYGIDGVVRYCQWRNIKNTKRGYVSLKGAQPRLDCWPFQHFGRGVLILTEGPIDAMKIRSLFNMWASPTYGAQFKKYIAQDVVRLQHEDKINGVIILYDNDEVGRMSCRQLKEKLKFKYGLDNVVSTTTFKSKDPADAPSDELISVITKAMGGLK